MHAAGDGLNVPTPDKGGQPLSISEGASMSAGVMPGGVLLPVGKCKGEITETLEDLPKIKLACDSWKGSRGQHFEWLLKHRFEFKLSEEEFPNYNFQASNPT